MHDWKQVHREAMTEPRGMEAVVVSLVSICDALSRKYATDGVLDEGVAHLILGTLVLLNGETGRLDCGTLDSQLRNYAERIGFNLDVEEFAGGRRL